MSKRAKKSEQELTREEEVAQYALGASKEELDQRYPKRPHNHARTPPFSELVDKLFTPLVDIMTNKAPRGRQRKVNEPTVSERRRHLVEKFIKEWRANVGDDIYPAFRLILSDKDRDRGTYGLKEAMIAKLLIKLMFIDFKSTDAQNLIHWKDPGKDLVSSMAGDFAGRCYDVIKKRKSNSGPSDMRIGDVNILLDRLAAASGETEQRPILEKFYHRMSANEMLWLVRILLRQPLRIGATQTTFLSLWHPDADALYSVSSSLRRVCWELWDPKFRLTKEATGITLMQCFQPQIAQFQPRDKSMQQIVKRMRLDENNPEFWIEEKLDGERMQMHMRKDGKGGTHFMFWSRKGKDYTYLYGDSYDDGSAALTRHLRGAFRNDVRNLILDGEMVTWDPETNKMLAFGSLKGAALLEKTNSFDNGPRPMFRVYDMVYCNDKNLSRYSLRDRRKALKAAVLGTPHRLEIHDYKSTTRVEDIEPALRDINQEGGEGLVLKNPNSIYRLSERHDEWMKVKPEYMLEFGESLDLVIIGGYWGSGHRGGTLSSFMCGLRPSKNYIRAGTNPEKCFSFCKVGGGLKAEDYREIKHLIGDKWIDWRKQPPPSEYIAVAGDIPDVWIRPSRSVVISIKGASFTPSGMFAAGWTLRFPRFRRLRNDKPWTDGMDMDGLEEVRNKTDEQEREKKMELEIKRARSGASKRQRVIVGTDPDAQAEFAEQSKMFQGLEFCILTGSKKPVCMEKPGLVHLVKKNGSSVTEKYQTSNSPGHIIIGESLQLRVLALVKSGVDVDIVRPKWIFDCLAQPEPVRDLLLPFEESHLFHATEATKKRARKYCDKYGDSYLRVADDKELRDTLRNMPDANKLQTYCDPGTEDEEGNKDDELVERLKGWAFRRCRVYFAPSPLVSDLELLRLGSYVGFGHGEIVVNLDETRITHIVLVGEDTHTAQLAGDYRREIRTWSKIPRLVTGQWILDSWRESTRLDEELYAPI